MVINMAEYKESTENPLHRQFGVWNNTIYILKKVKQYCPSAIPIALMGIICGSILSYYWGIVGKYVIDLVQADADIADNMDALLKIMLIAGGIAGILIFGNSFSQNKTWYRFIYTRMQMINERVDRALGLNYQMLETPDVLDVHERATQATGGNNNGVEGMMNLMVTLGRNLVTVLVTFTAVMVLNWGLIICLIALGILQYLYYRKIIKEDKREVWDKLAPMWRQANYMARITQDFDYAKDIRLFNLSDFLIGKQRQVFAKREDRIDYSKELWFRHAVVSQFLYLVIKGMIYAALFYAVLNKGMSIGSFTMYLALAFSFSDSLLQFLHRFGDYERASMEVDDFRSFMELDMAEEEDTIPIPEARDYTIEFHDVCYRYLKQEKNAVDHLNMVLHPGEKLAVVGLNGAGKTTMIKLLLRLYDPTEGVITLNGVDIRKFKREEYYKLFSPVFQNIEVLAFPIAEHISMKVAEDTDRDRAQAAAVEAGLEDKIKALPKGIDSELLKIVDDNGVDLSGGEKQKLALARALYKSAPMVVLDEPTSALDALAEQQLYERFNHMIGDKSAVYISHRLASTRFCDRVAMFADGRMIEYGSHDELMEKGGEYARMFEMQAQYYQEEQKEAEE
ncbi:MAG: ABC transporter ATP-binding protein/permease [Acetatifactor sp.]|nr:ABC transporter ATP-binding protein/permease [Acetatifactor sp.]